MVGTMDPSSTNWDLLHVSPVVILFKLRSCSPSPPTDQYPPSLSNYYTLNNQNLQDMNTLINSSPYKALTMLLAWRIKQKFNKNQSKFRFLTLKKKLALPKFRKSSLLNLAHSLTYFQNLRSSLESEFLRSFGEINVRRKW